MLGLYRRHRRHCPHLAKGRAYLRCQCPLWVDGRGKGRRIHKALDTADWQTGQQMVRDLETEPSGAEKRIETRPLTLEQAWMRFLIDLDIRRLHESTLRKYRLLKKQMLEFATLKGFKLLNQLDIEALDEFRGTWKVGAQTSLKKLERLRAFFRFAVDRDWVKQNPAIRLSKPRVDDRPTMPLSDDEWTSILVACDKLIASNPKPRFKLPSLRLKALVLLMRYSGMRVSDAVMLTANKLQGHKLFLYTQKTGQPVYTILPDLVVTVLEATPRVTNTLYFWNGQSGPEAIVGYWQKRLRDLFEKAGVVKGPTNAVSHRLRDTFATKLLECGTSIETVSVLLGHKSIRITEKHYNPWVRSRQEQLEADLMRVWSADPGILATRRLHEKNQRPN